MRLVCANYSPERSDLLDRSGQIDHLQVHRGGQLPKAGLAGRPLRRLGRRRGAGMDLGKDKGARRG